MIRPDLSKHLVAKLPPLRASFSVRQKRARVSIIKVLWARYIASYDIHSYNVKSLRSVKRVRGSSFGVS